MLLLPAQVVLGNPGGFGLGPHLVRVAKQRVDLKLAQFNGQFLGLGSHDVQFNSLGQSDVVLFVKLKLERVRVG